MTNLDLHTSNAKIVQIPVMISLNDDESRIGPPIIVPPIYLQSSRSFVADIFLSTVPCRFMGETKTGRK